MSEARVPLQIGASASRNAVLGASLIVPGSFLVRWGSQLGSFGWIVAIFGLALVGVAIQCLVMAWRERPSDLSVKGSSARVDGGPHHGFALEDGQTARISLREDLRSAADGPSLEVAPKDGTAHVVAHAEGAADRGRLERLRDVLLGRTTLATNLRGRANAVRATRRASFVLLFIVFVWPLTGALYAWMDHRNVASTRALIALAFVPLIVSANGHFFLQLRIVERRSAENALEEARKWRRAIAVSLPLLAVALFGAKSFAARSSDVSATAAAHGFDGHPAGESAPHADVRASLAGVLATEPGITIESVSFDPSGTRVAYIRTDLAGHRSARVSFTRRGELKDADAPVVSEDADRVAWSPVKQQLAFSTTTKPVHVAVVPTPFVKDAPQANSGFGAEKPVTGAGEWGTDPVWSPDGSRLAYISYGTDRFGVHQVYVLDSSFEEPAQQLTQGDADCTELTWSADGWIVFSARGRRQRVKP